MTFATHTSNALLATLKLKELGISIEVQQKIGVFAVTWGLFESHLERAVWVLRNEQVEGTRPSTDKTSAHKWIEVLESGRNDLTPKANYVLKTAALAAKDLMSYRHSLFHGYLVPGDTAMFIRNPSWHGEVRNRECGDAYIDDNMIDLAIDASWVLFTIIMSITKLTEDVNTVILIESFEKEAKRIRSNANEIRHIAALMNYERY
ncbi:hypothetical protein [Pseudoalteromonas sp. SCSIO 43101]|uniref:hypothetical protein n=1 Tax=Pseudoalteromonas sp. SCSIO 43101 TaxID=2822847 RepID=UPI00202B3B6C|nr:hypothetical protein [Pseudoalteromonas sp. SCSIO 43101]URQ89996.1 hypothetical protein J8Z25_14735 [Pseudoalteromonas sp. SCSIO 43101]